MPLLADSGLIEATPGLMIWTLVCFGIAFFVLKRFAFGPIQKTIDERRDRIRSSVEEAEHARSEARRLLEEHKQLIGQAKGEAGEILAEARKVADSQRERARNRLGKIRLPAAERRQAIVEAAMMVFSTGSYSGATTADIAREAGVSEPILYRHFASKRELYFACLDEAWLRLRLVFDEKVALHEQGGSMPSPGEMALRLRQTARVLPPNLWIQALTEAGEDPEIARYLRRHMRDVHDFMADGIRRAQAAGGIAPDRDPDAEAWIFLAGILLLSIGDRLGGLLDDEDFAAIAAQRIRWLSGAG